MTTERLEEIFETTDSKWEGDNAYMGLSILMKYTDYVLHAAEHDIIYGPDCDTVIEGGLTEEDAIKLAMLNWMVDEDHGCFTCFV